MRAAGRIALAGAALLALAGTAHAQDMVLTGATLVDPSDGSTRPDSVIVVRGGTIEAVGSVDTLRPPAGLAVVEARGKWVVPGYIDGHIHFFQSGGLYARPDGIDLQAVRPYAQEIAMVRADLPDILARYLASGVTGVADVGGPMGNFAIRAETRDNPRSPRVAVAGPLISTFKPPVVGDAPDPPIIRAADPEAARALVRAQAAHKPDFIKVWYVLQQGEDPAVHLPVVTAAIDEATRLGLRVAVHATELETARAALTAGADILVHGVEDRPVDDAFLALLKRSGALYTTTLDVYPGYIRSFTGAHGFTREEFALADPEVMGTLLDKPALPAGEARRFLEGMAGKPIPAEPLSTLYSNLIRVRDAGVPIVMGTDAGNIGTLPGPSIYREFARMAEAGMTAREILASATVNGARLMGWEDRLGRIAPGRLADMVVLDADPLADSANLARIALVVKGGTAFRPHDLVPQTPVEVVQRQLNAYNARDLEAFLATYAPDAKLLDFPASVQTEGREAMRKLYGGLFARFPGIHAQVPRRSVVGNFVIDEEVIRGVPGMEDERAVAIYEVRDGLIRQVTFIAPPPEPPKAKP